MKRAVGKKLIGAQASAEIWRGVDAWLVKNPRKSVTDFILEACMEKLAEAGIKLDQDAALFDGRRRVPSFELNEVSESKIEIDLSKTQPTSYKKSKKKT